MSNTKSVEQQLKEAIEASKQTLALSEQVTSLAQEKDTLSKRLAEIETTLSAPKASEVVAVDPLVIAKLGELLAERELTAKAMKELSAKADAAMAYATKVEKEAAKKADLNKYVERGIEEGDEGNSPAEKQHQDAGVKKGTKAEMPDFIKEKIEDKEESEDEACDYKGKKGKKAAKASYDDESEGLTEDELEMLKEYRASCKAKKADSNLKAPLKEEKKDFGDIIPQPGLDPNKNNVNPDNTTSPSLNKKLAAKAKSKAETDVEEIMESPDMQKKEDAEGGEENEVHEKTLSKPGKGAKKAYEVALEAIAAKKGNDTSEEIPAALMEYLQQIVDEEKAAKAKKAGNSLPGMNKKDVTGTEDQDGEESFLKKDGKKAENLEKCVKDNCADDTTKVHEDGCAPTKGNTTPVGDLAPLASASLDSVVDVAVERLASVAKAKQAVEAKLAEQGATLASETKAKDEAYTAVAQLQAKFEALMTKLSKAEATDNALEAKAAKIVGATAHEPVGADIQGAEAPKTDAEFLAAFEAIADKREQNRFFKAHASAISRAAQVNLKARRS
jgi:hypothetical protein